VVRKLAADLCVIGVLAGLIAGCSPRAQPGPLTTVRPAPALTVRLPAGSGAVTATSVPGATAALTAPVQVSGRNLPSGIAVLAPAEQLALRGAFPASGVVLSFHVRPGSVPAGSAPFLASLDAATGSWTPVPSRYDASTATVSARVTHFSVWTVLDWVRSHLAAVLRGALSDIFGPLQYAGSPECAGATADSTTSVTLTDSHPGGSVGACAKPAGGTDVLAKVTDRRHYPLDLLYPKGDQVSVPSADLFSQLGEDLNNLSSDWHERVLLPGGAEADATLLLPAGHSAALVTEMDTEAYLTGILGTGLNVLALMAGKLGESTAKVLGFLARGSCLRDLVRAAQTASLTLQATETLGAVAFECITAAAKLGTAGVVITVASIMSSLASELLGGLWGIIDTATGNGYHVLAITRHAAPTVYLPCCGLPGPDQKAQIASGEDYRPHNVSFDATGSHIVQNATWQIWNSAEAVATGTADINSCEPACAGGRYVKDPVILTLSKPRLCEGTWFWSEVLWHFPAGIPPGETQNAGGDILYGC
jgi:hypothetical protein